MGALELTTSGRDTHDDPPKRGAVQTAARPLLTPRTSQAPKAESNKYFYCISSCKKLLGVNTQCSGHLGERT